jgi:hypothetical protein
VPLPSIIWDGLDINPGHLDGGVTAIVEDVTGWYGTPPLDGGDSERALADGGAFGHKVIGPRQVEITGAVAAPRSALMDWHDMLTSRAAQRAPSQMSVEDPELGITLTAMVRAGTDQFRHQFIAGREAFRWQAVVTAADPLLYSSEWQQVILGTTGAADSGRAYPRWYDEHEWPGWEYGNPLPPGSAAYVRNDGNADAPMYATYTGDLTASRLDLGTAAGILVQPLVTGEQIIVPTATLHAQAVGGASRASFVRPGSRPLLIPARTTARIHLYALGSGTVTVDWRSAWW